MVRIVALTAALACTTALISPFHKKTIDTFILQASKAEDTLAPPADQWFENQKLDHTDPTNKKVWKQRFHVNDAWFKGGNSPVFVYINGENVADPATTTSSSYFMNELAVKHGALVVSLEHRFYGRSQPTGDLKTESLKYLTMEQALGDLADFQDYFATAANLTAANKWITFGGSYPGMLSGYAKLKYPTRFAGSVASSAPIHTKTDFYEYSEVVAYGLKFFGGEKCTATIGQGLKELHALVASTKPEDAATLNKYFNLCSPIKTDLDRMTVEVGVFGSFQGIAQYNGFQPYSLTDVCNDFAKPGTPLELLSKHVQGHGWDSRNCTGTDYQTEWIAPFSDTTVSDNIYRQWIYQTCAEFGFGQTTAKSNSIFGVLSYGTVDAVYYELCKQVFGITNTEDRAAATRAKYGALKIDVENVVWPGGTVDPWWALSLSNSSTPVNPKSTLVDIEGTAHCADMYNTKYKLIPAWASSKIEASVQTYLRDQC